MKKDMKYIQHMYLTMNKPSIPIPIINCPDFVYTPITNNIYELNTFDDGNQKYEHFENKYLKIGHYKQHPEKIALLNIDLKTIISSISSWKVSLTNNTL